MTAKIKTNILYIASDNSSQDQNQVKGAQIQKKQSISSKKQFNLKGTHKMNNNRLSRGYFNHASQQQQYQYEKDPKFKASKPAMQTRSKRLVSQMGQQDPDHKQLSQTQCHEVEPKKTQTEIKQSTSEYQNNNLKPQKVKRAKTLLFQFKSDDQSNQSQAKTKQQLCQTIKEIQNVVNNNNIQSVNCTKQENTQPKPTKMRKSLSPSDMEAKIDKKQFLISQIPQGSVLECKVFKINQITNFLFPQYNMIFKNFTSVHLASCKKYIGNLTSNYRISLQKDDFNYFNQNVLGKVRQLGNKNNVYNVFDSGKNPEKFTESNPDRAGIRQILATIRIKCGKGPRKIEVYLLNHFYNYHNLLGISLTKQINLQSLYSIQENRKHIKLLRSRQPIWIPSKGQYFLDFEGRVNQASIRNFILQDSQSGKQVLMFGKNKDNIYHLDVSYPLTPTLGLAIVIPQLDRDQ